MRFESRLALVVACLALPGLALAGVTNSVPVEDGFESYDVGTSIGGTNGWVGDDAVVTNNPASAVAGSSGLPMSDPHTKTLAVNADLTLNVTNDVNTWIDFMVQPELRESAPTLEAGVQAAFFFDTNGNLTVYHGDFPATQLWTTVSDSISSGDWIRVSIEMDYESSTPAQPFFRVLLDGTAVADSAAYDNPTFGSSQSAASTWFMAASGGVVGNGSADQLNSFGTQGSCVLDDVVVSAAAPNFGGAGTKVSVCTSVVGGSLSPDGDITIGLGSNGASNQVVAITASNLWEVTGIIWNGETNPVASGVSSTNVTVYNDGNCTLYPDYNLYCDGNSTLCATFGQTEINGVPASYYTSRGLVDGGGNPDPDGNGDSDDFTNEEEAHFGTDPLDGNEYPMVISVESDGATATVVFLGSDLVIDTDFTIERATDLVAGDWVDYDTTARAAATDANGGGTNTYVDTSAPADGAFYRPKAVVNY